MVVGCFEVILLSPNVDFLDFMYSTETSSDISPWVLVLISVFVYVISLNSGDQSFDIVDPVCKFVTR